jgi:glycosyltransferase involved in cell wall biosynthesis
MWKVLTIAYDFPPRRTSGVYRTTNLVKYLGGLGWKPTILTVKERSGDLEDPSLLRDLPSEIRVERVRDLNISGWEERAEVAIHTAGGLKSDYREAQQPFWDRWIRAGGHFLRSALYFPDKTVGWLPLALARAMELHMQHRFDIVYTTHPPRSAPVVGMLLRNLLGIPWVAEFRDPWYLHPRPFRRGSDRMLLHQMLKTADMVITTSKGLATDFQLSYGLPQEKLAVINNGYEEEDFFATDGRRSEVLAPGRFHFSHFGTVYAGFTGRFFDALRELFQESPELRSRIRINIIGFPDEDVRREASSSDLGEVIELHGFVDHATAITAMRSSDCLLIFLGNRRVARLAVAGKIYEYLRAGRPILAVTYEGDLAQLIREGQAGWVVNPEDTHAIKQALREALCHDPGSGGSSPICPDFVEQFRYDRLAERLAGVFDSVLNHDS